MAYVGPAIPASGTTFAELPASGATGHLNRLAAQIVPKAAPGAWTITASGGGTTGGLLTAGTYYVVVTETDGIGETAPTAEQSVVVAAGDIPQITFASLQPGNLARNVYVGVASGAETLYASGVETATYNLGGVQPAGTFAAPPPAANTTGLSLRNLSSLRLAGRGRLQMAWDNFARAYESFARGDAMDFPTTIAVTRDAQLLFGALAGVAAEFGALVDSNPGHLATTTTGIGGVQTRRVWP